MNNNHHDPAQSLADYNPEARQAWRLNEPQPPPFLPPRQQAPRGKAASYDAPPLSRRRVDAAVPGLRLIGGVLFVAYSSASTIRGVGSDVLPALPGASLLPNLPDALIAGIVAAVAIFVLEIVLAERSRYGYMLVLAVDAWYTFRQLKPGMESIVRARALSPFLVDVLTIAAGGALAIAVAMFGEILLFGRRRPRR